MERLPNFNIFDIQEKNGQYPVVIYSRFGESLKQLVDKLPANKPFQLGNDLRGKARWFAQEVFNGT